MHVKLTPRLAAIAKYVPEGSSVADIGTDHAYLPVYLLTQKISQKVIATDIHENPLSSAIELMEMLNLTRKIDIRLGDGLRVLKPAEADVIVLAGMGGGTMAHILDASPEVVASIKRLIVQPMVRPSRVRTWIEENKFEIVDEDLVEDDGIIYEIIIAEPGSAKYTFEEIFIGPQILAKKPVLLKKYLLQQQITLQENLVEMDKSDSLRTSLRKKEYQMRLEILDKVIACL